MFAKINVENLDAAENGAREILKHVEAIRRLQLELSWHSVKVEINVSDSEAASGN